LASAVDAVPISAVDTVIVGGGPAGLLCALGLAGAGRSVALIERGGRIAESLCPKVVAGMDVHRGNLRNAERFRDQCGRCTCLQGIGGAAMHFDSNLGYVRQLSRPKIELGPDGEVVRYNLLERLFDSAEKAETLIAEAYATLAKFGLAMPPHTAAADYSTLVNDALFAHTDTSDSLPAPLTQIMPIIGAMEIALEELGCHLLVRQRVVSLESSTRWSRLRKARWTLDLEGMAGERWQLQADNVVLAVGKVAMPWIQQVLNDLGLDYRPTETVDIGVRLETLRIDLEWMTRSCHYPKLTFLSGRKEAVRTFCVCAGGRMMQYEFDTSVVLDGQHCIENPTERTNFGILTTVKTPRGVDAAEYALNITRMVNRLGDGGPLVQTVGDFMAGQPTTSIAGGPLRSSLVRPALGNLHACLPAFLVDDIRAMIDRLNALSAGAIQPYAFLAAPVIERAFPAIALTPNMESSQPGLYFAGDCSGKIIGITYAMATGLCVSRAILQAKNSGLACGRQ
jgi:uncharacterized FAD-dependent dehydrogenase